MLSRTIRGACWCPCVPAVCAARGGCGGVVDGDTASWDVLSEKTATPVSVRITIDA
jgi:hypothetical protein